MEGGHRARGPSWGVWQLESPWDDRSRSHFPVMIIVIKAKPMGFPGGSVVACLPSAQGVIPGSWDRVPIGLPAEILLLPLSLPVSVSFMNK